MSPFHFYWKTPTYLKIEALWYSVLSLINKNNTWTFAGPKRLPETVLKPREVLFGPPSQPRNSTIQPDMYYLWQPWSSVSLFRLLWTTLVVPVLPDRMPHSPPLPSHPTLERWVIWTCSIMWLGICFHPRPFELRSLLSRGWKLVWRLKDDSHSCEWCIWALCQVLLMPGCYFRALAAISSPVVFFHFQLTTNCFHSWCLGLLWNWCHDMQDICTELFPEIKKSHK